MKRALLATVMNAALLTACGGSESLPLNVSSGGSPSGAVHKFVKVNVTFHFTGAPQSFTVPEGVTHLEVIVSGAAGGGDAGGPGGTIEARVSVHAGQVLGIFVGGKGSPLADKKGGAGGYNGGARGGDVRICRSNETCYGGAGGGGASDIRDGGEHAGLDKRLVIAGGGGGEAAANVGWWAGGDGGRSSGGNGGAYYERFKGHGGTPNAGGRGGEGECFLGDPKGKDGTFGEGGRGGNECTEGRKAWAGGGGGGGYNGGGGGSGNHGEFCVLCAFPYNGSGGGGSGGVAAGAKNVRMLPSANRDDGYVTISTGP